MIRKADSGVAFGYAVTSCSVISTERSEIFLNPGNSGSHKNERSCHHSDDAAEDPQQLRAMAGRLLISSQTRRSPQGEVGPGNGTLLHRTAAGFTSTGIPDDFAVLCQLIAPCRRCPHRYAGGLSPLRSGSIRFLSIRSRFSHSVACIASLAGRLRCAPAPSRGRSPFRAWPLVVVSFHFWYFYRGIESHLQRAHAGHTQAVTSKPSPAVRLLSA